MIQGFDTLKSMYECQIKEHHPQLIEFIKLTTSEVQLKCSICYVIDELEQDKYMEVDANDEIIGKIMECHQLNINRVQEQQIDQLMNLKVICLDQLNKIFEFYQKSILSKSREYRNEYEQFFRSTGGNKINKKMLNDLILVFQSIKQDLLKPGQELQKLEKLISEQQRIIQGDDINRLLDIIVDTYKTDKYLMNQIKQIQEDIPSHLQITQSEIYNKEIMIKEKQQIYFGDFTDNLYHGKGLLLDNAIKKLYYGFWQAGIFIWGIKLDLQKQELFKGNFYLLNNEYQIENQGYWTNIKQDIYQGAFNNEQFEGIGKLEYKNGQIYKGYWQKGQWHGEGELTFPNEDTFIGQFVKGDIQGYGKFSSSDQIYEGQFKNNKREGKGKLTDQKTQTIYEGQFKNNTKEGVGELIYANGNKYVGLFQNDMQNGHGYEIIIQDKVIGVDDLFNSMHENLRGGVSKKKLSGNYVDGKRDELFEIEILDRDNNITKTYYQFYDKGKLVEDKIQFN